MRIWFVFPRCTYYNQNIRVHEVKEMLISTRGRYALRILVDMAEHQADDFVPLREIARRQDISEKYLESIVKDLVKNNVVTGQRGKGGGYRLSSPPEMINVGDVLYMTEGTLAPVSCLEKDAPSCPRVSQCRTLEFWKGLDQVIQEYTRKFVIADLMWKGETGNDYII